MDAGLIFISILFSFISMFFLRQAKKYKESRVINIVFGIAVGLLAWVILARGLGFKF